MTGLDNLYAGGPVWVTKTKSDAAVLLSFGYPAVSTDEEGLTRALRDKKPYGPIILADQSNSILNTTLTAEQIEYYQADSSIYLDSDTITDAARDNREGVKEEIEKAMGIIGSLSLQHKSLADYMAEDQGRESYNLQRAGKKSTGFETVDKMTNQLEMGLYTIIAATGIGKTSLCLQMADSMAMAGHQVIYIALEQGQLELASKSEARFHNMRQMLTGGNHYITANDIRWGKSTEERLTAAKDYAELTGSRLTVLGTDQIRTAEDIRDYVTKVVRYTGKRPVVFVDYLQLLRGSDIRTQTDKQICDHSVEILTTLCKDLLITCIAISSTTKASHSETLDVASGANSIGIAYGGSGVWSLEFAVTTTEAYKTAKATEKATMIEKAESENPRQMVLRQHKSRSSAKRSHSYLEYYPALEIYRDKEGATQFPQFSDTTA